MPGSGPSCVRIANTIIKQFSLRNITTYDIDEKESIVGYSGRISDESTGLNPLF